MAVLSPSSLLAQQTLPVKKIVNARDLGGYEVPGGLRVKTGWLIRSAHLADATPADIEYLAGLPLGTVVDFRLEPEKRGKEDLPVPGARYVSIPIDASGGAAETATEKEKKKFLKGGKFDVKKVIVMAAFNEKAGAIARNMYPNIFLHAGSQRQMAAFLRLVVDAGDKPILFHCTQGKDRSGAASALLLTALGAERETLVADFAATNVIYEADVRKYIRRVKFWGGKEAEIGVVKAFIGANTDYFVQTLDTIIETYGSMDAYLKGPMGLSEGDIQILRGRYLE